MHLYNFIDYCGMLTDKSRLEAYVRALKDVITPESVVLDLGAGTGVFSILACDFGAKKVYAVEVNPWIKLLEEVIKERGYVSKIEIIQKLSNEIELEEKANVLVSDIHGGFPLHESSIETIMDARDRLVTNDVVLIPRKETIYFGISQSEEIYRKNVNIYLQDFHGFKVPSSERFVINRWFRATDENEVLLSEPGVFAEIDYRTINRTSFSNRLEWEITADGTAHGLRGWFENELSDNSGVSNAIEFKDTTYATPFFPFEKPVELKKGDTVSAEIAANYEKGNYTWSWRTKFFEQGDKLKTGFNQSVVASLFLDPQTVLKQSEYFVPTHNKTAEIDLFILSSMDGEIMHGDISDALLEKFPEKFRNFGEALDYVSELSQKYSN
jgi:type I protein arginine methyltransferase